MWSTAIPETFSKIAPKSTNLSINHTIPVITAIGMISPVNTVPTANVANAATFPRSLPAAVIAPIATVEDVIAAVSPPNATPAFTALAFNSVIVAVPAAARRACAIDVELVANSAFRIPAVKA